MLKKTLSFLITIVLIQLTIFAAPFSTATKKDVERASKIKAAVERFGEQTRVKIRLKNNARIEGIISRIEPEQFAVTSANNREVKTIAYQDVKQVKKNNLSTAAKVGIGAAIGAALVGAIILITGHRSSSNKGKPCPLIYPERCP